MGESELVIEREEPPRRPPAASPRRPSRSFARRLHAGDVVAHVLVFAAALSIILLTALLVFELYKHSALPRHKFGWDFLWTRTWDPVTETFGALPFIYGTVVTSALAMLIAVPLGVLAALFLAEFASRRLSNWLTFFIELLAAVPSVIYGFLGMFLIVPFMRDSAMPFLKATVGFLPFFQGPVYGVGILTAGVVLAIMIAPFIVSISREIILSVPRDQREAALAVGATRWETTWKVVLPYARAGILGSIFLALARALGETMAVTMVIGCDPKIVASLFSPGYSVAAVIANEFAEATSPTYVQALIELGLVLFAVTIVVNGLARLLIHATNKWQAVPS